MKRLELAFNIISIFTDAIGLLAAAVIAYFLRFRSQYIFANFPVMFDLSFSDFLRNAVLAIPFLLIIISLYGLYNLRSTRQAWNETAHISAAVSTGLMAYVAIYFFNPSIFPSRLIVLITWVFAIFLVSALRLLLLGLERAFLRRGVGLHRLVLIRGESDYDLAKAISERPELGYKIVNILRPAASENIVPQLELIHTETGIDEILQASTHLSGKQNGEILRFTHDRNIRFNYVPDIIEAQQTNIATTDIAGIPVIQVKNTPLDGWGKLVKRAIDIVLSLVGIIVLSPLMLAISVIVKIDSRGRILFVQERYGQGKPFRFYKFRSMFQEMSEGDQYGGEKAHVIRQELWKQNARSGGPFLKIKNDPRVTRFGRLIRKTKLDELPQLFNVLRGEMSLVGPRAHVLEEVNLYRDSYQRQFTIKPGITGLTQVTQARIPELPFDEEIRLNTFYLENWSLGLDAKIILDTFRVLLHKPKADEYY